MKRIVILFGLTAFALTLNAQWIANGEVMSSVRTKLNNLKAEAWDSSGFASDLDGVTYLENINDSVGIGTETPAEKLDVTGNTRQDTSKFASFYWTDNTTGIVTTGTIQAGSALQFGETTTPTAKTDTGALYTKSDNALYFQDGAGTEHEVSYSTTSYAEMYQYDAARTVTIDEAATDNLMRSFTTGSVSGWTFDAGSTGTITAVANAGGGILTITSAAHGLLENSVISIRGTTNYNGVFVIDSLNVNQFQITDTWVADEAGDWDEGSCLIAGASAAGEYQVSFSLSGSAAATKVMRFMIYKGTTLQTKIVAERYFVDGNIVPCGSASGFVTIAADDRITISVEGVTDGTDFVIENCNVNLKKL